MRAVLLSLVAVSILSCPPMSAERAPDADPRAEQFALAIIRKPARTPMKPCRETRCGAVSRAKLMANRDSTYIDLLVSDDSLIRRWSVRVAQPVRVWIAPPPADAALLHTRLSPVAHLQRAFRTWESAGVPVRFAFVRDSASAEVHVRWADVLPHQRAGLARRRTDARNWLRGGEVVLALRDSAGARYPVETFLGVAVHEVGHVLGLEHSDVADDVMAPAVRVTEPSIRDRTTARLLYSYTAGRVR